MNDNQNSQQKLTTPLDNLLNDLGTPSVQPTTSNNNNLTMNGEKVGNKIKDLDIYDYICLYPYTLLPIILIIEIINFKFVKF